MVFLLPLDGRHYLTQVRLDSFSHHAIIAVGQLAGRVNCHAPGRLTVGECRHGARQPGFHLRIVFQFVAISLLDIVTVMGRLRVDPLRKALRLDAGRRRRHQVLLGQRHLQVRAVRVARVSDPRSAVHDLPGFG